MNQDKIPTGKYFLLIRHIWIIKNYIYIFDAVKNHHKVNENFQHIIYNVRAAGPGEDVRRGLREEKPSAGERYGYADNKKHASDYEEAYIVATTPATRTSPTIATMHTSFNLSRKAIRGFVNQHIRPNYRMTPTYLNGMGLRSHDTVHSQVGSPSELVVIDPEVADGTARFILKMRNAVTGSQAISPKYSGIAAAIHAGDNPPADLDPYSGRLVTKSPYHLTSKDADRGKRVYITACYQSKRRARGQWCKSLSVTIH